MDLPPSDLPPCFCSVQCLGCMDSTDHDGRRPADMHPAYLQDLERRIEEHTERVGRDLERLGIPRDRG